MKGSLPWQGIQCKDRKEKHSEIKNLKARIAIDTLCKGMPEQFETYLLFCRHLKFDETPNYEYLIQLFSWLLQGKGHKNDCKWDW